MFRDFQLSELCTLLNSVTPSILRKNLISDVAFVIALVEAKNMSCLKAVLFVLNSADFSFELWL